MLGGGKFTAQNKILTGSYINVVSKTHTVSTMLGERGIVALPIGLTWGPSGVFAVTAKEFEKDSLKIFGYPYDADEMKAIRDVFKNAQKVLFYNLNDSSGAAATCQGYATAKYVGTRGNSLKVVVQKNIDDTSLFDVSVYLGTTEVDKQIVATASELVDNDFVKWTASTLEVTAGVPFTGGTDGNTTTTSHQNALNAFEAYNFNVLLCATEVEKSVKEVYVAYTKRLRDEVGVKFQLVTTGVEADYEGVVNLNEKQSAALPWLAGTLAGCAVNKSCTNMTYTGEAEIPCTETQTELEVLIKKGVFAFHKVEDEVRTLLDINSLVTFTDTKGEMFSKNQVVRVADQCANDTAKIFNNEFLGKIQNNASGRISLWNRIVAHRRELETMTAIEKYDADALTVEAGEKRDSVVVNEEIVPMSAMEKLYMTIVIN